MTTPDRPTHRWGETPRSALLALALALPGAALLGGLTSFAQGFRPDALRSLATSAGGWTMFAILLVWLGRARPVVAAVLGLVAFEALNEGYGLVSGWRGNFYATPFSSVWTLVGLAAGPVVGVAASLRRHGRPLWRMLAITPLSAVLLGEGYWALGRRRHHEPRLLVAGGRPVAAVHGHRARPAEPVLEASASGRSGVAERERGVRGLRPGLPGLP